MLTRLEVHGFKNLLGFKVDFGPYNCIAGPNGVGKSNLFDAIHLLSLLADRPITEAAVAVRGADQETGDLRDLFWTDGENRLEAFTLAAEMLVEPHVVDDFGRTDIAQSTYLRYELALGYEPPGRQSLAGRLVLRSESLEHITETAAAKRLAFPHHPRHFRRRLVRNRRSSPYISTEMRDGGPFVVIHQHGVTGPLASAPAASAPHTLLRTVSTTSHPTILAARREMQSWRTLALEPTALRRVDRYHSEQQVGPRGNHIAAALFHLAQDASRRGETAEQVYARVASRLSDLVGILDIEIRPAEPTQLLYLRVREESGAWLPARSLSDGTLRFLALSIIAEDPSARGVVCMEEPENGIHPAKMEAMNRLLRDLAINPAEEPGESNPLRQVIIATHSPVLVQLQEADDLLAATRAHVAGPYGGPASTLRCRPLIGSWRARAGSDAVGKASILAYLTAPSGAHLSLETELARTSA